MANYGIKVETVLGKFYDVRQDETIKGLYEVRKKENPEEDIMWYFFQVIMPHTIVLEMIVLFGI